MIVEGKMSARPAEIKDFKFSLKDKEGKGKNYLAKCEEDAKNKGKIQAQIFEEEEDENDPRKKKKKPRLIAVIAYTLPADGDDSAAKAFVAGFIEALVNRGEAAAKSYVEQYSKKNNIPFTFTGGGDKPLNLVLNQPKPLLSIEDPRQMPLRRKGRLPSLPRPTPQFRITKDPHQKLIDELETYFKSQNKNRNNEKQFRINKNADDGTLEVTGEFGALKIDRNEISINHPSFVEVLKKLWEDKGIDIGKYNFKLEGDDTKKSALAALKDLQDDDRGDAVREKFGLQKQGGELVTINDSSPLKGMVKAGQKQHANIKPEPPDGKKH